MSSKFSKAIHLPFGMGADELQQFAERMVRSLNSGGAAPYQLPQKNETIVIPEEIMRLSWTKRMAYFAAQFRKGRVPESHVDWLHEQVTNDPRMMQTIFSVSGESGPLLDGKLTKQQDIALTEAMIKMHGLARWADFGFNVFRLSDSLAAMLALTDATAKFSDIKLSFPAFFISVPTGYIPAGDYTGPVRLLVHQHLRRLVYNDDGTYQETDGDNGTEEQWLRIEIYEDGFNPATVINKRIEDLSSDIISNQLMKWVSDESVSGRSLVADTDKSADLVVEAAVRMACSFALWVNATDALEGSSPQPRPRLKKKDRKKGRKPGFWPNVWVIGNDIKLDKELRDTAKEQSQDPKKRRKGWKLRTQKIVRGHFKRQRHGPGNKLVKIIFIEPYPRGPEDAEAWTSNFQADGE